MKRIKKIKPVAHKRVLNTLKKYEQRKETEKGLKSEIVDAFSDDIKQYLTKSGRLKKNLSKKRVKEFNEKTTAFKKAGYSTLKGIKKQNKKLIDEKREEKQVSRGYIDTKEHAEEVTSLLQDKFVNALANKGYLNIYKLTDFVEEDDDSVEDFKEVAEYIVNQLEQDTPQELEELLENEDDTYKFMKEYKDNKAIKYLTREMFKKWLKELLSTANAEAVKKEFKIDSYDKINADEHENLYKKFLNGDFNRYL